MKKDYIQTATHIFMLLLILSALILLSAGFRFEVDKLATLEFWGNVGARLVLAMMVFNLVYKDFFKKRKQDRTSKHFYAVATKQVKTKVIFEKRLFKELDKAIEDENKERYIAECDRMLHKVTMRLNYSDLPFNEDGTYKKEVTLTEWFESFAEELSLNDKLKKRFRKIAYKIISGTAPHLDPITADDLLIEPEDTFDTLKPMVFSEGVAQRKSNIKKVVMYIFSCIALVVISYEPTWYDFMFNIVTNLMLSCGALVSGMMEAEKNIKFRTEVYERQNEMLTNRLGIEEKWTGNDTN